MRDFLLNRRRFLGGLMALAAGGRTLAAPPVAAPMRIRVLTYNIHHGEGIDKKLDLDRIAAVIRKTDPDLVALQEVDRATARTGKVDQAVRLGELTKLTAAFGEAMKFGGGGYGNAILSRHKIAHTLTMQLPSSPKEEPRCLLLADIELPAATGMRKIRFGATHLNHRNAEERVKQVREILAETRMAGRDAMPTIIAGDFNAGPESEEVKLLTAAFIDATSKPIGVTATPKPPAGAPPEGQKLLSFPADAPKSKIDFILAAPAVSWKVVRAEAIAEAVASDHRPVLAELELA